MLSYEDEANGTREETVGGNGDGRGDEEERGDLLLRGTMRAIVLLSYKAMRKTQKKEKSEEEANFLSSSSSSSLETPLAPSSPCPADAPAR